MAFNQVLEGADGIDGGYDGDGNHGNNADHFICEVSMTSLDKLSSSIDFNTPTNKKRDGRNSKSNNEIIHIQTRILWLL
jgi:hypothetical protein